ncbi:MAG: polysulfide reductase NrfD [Pseudomonadales bacterium]|nr:polysulfide reductase NrfD [Pseudomonadales bacterium]MEE3143421.1 NrfD/PsrC family molybdoenzyme membrane anchor subunit [Pseudomonadota bacterium]|tara:strand:- start:728 stop:2083 length:1356 start_codon:yes stop_codon:yes gene_type:complete
MEAENNKLGYTDIHEDVVRSIVVTGPKYYATLATAGGLALVCFFFPWFYQLYYGIGAAGMNHPGVWGTYLASFIFWIGLSHSGTLLSCVLHLTNSSWRKAMYRSAEAMTLFSLVVAATYVFVHVGRPWFAHWTFPYPNQWELWPNFRSPLLFDVMAIATYLTGSTIFIYMGSIPDFAAVRDRTVGWRNTMYSLLSLGWRGTDTEWHRLHWAYTFLAVLIIPLAVSVHSIVSWDFAMSIVPGLHQTIFAPYFVVGAIYSGTAGIVTVMFVLRKYMGFEQYITKLHFDNLGKLLLLLSLLWTYINAIELFTGWYSGTSDEYEQLSFKLFGFYAPLYWEMILFCAVAPLLMISKRFRTSFVPMLILSIAINIGMYTERFLIVATSLPRQYLPDAWGFYAPSLVELSIMVGSFAVFTTLFLIFVKIFPSVSMYEVKETMETPKLKPAIPQAGSPA